MNTLIFAVLWLLMSLACEPELEDSSNGDGDGLEIDVDLDYTDGDTDWDVEEEVDIIDYDIEDKDGDEEIADVDDDLEPTELDDDIEFDEIDTDEQQLPTNWADCMPNNSDFPVRIEPDYAATLPFLHVNNRDILDLADKTVMLRGTNFASWLMMETSIAGIGDLFEQEFLDLIPIKADEFGVTDLIQHANDSTNLEWVSGEKSHWELLQLWRICTYEQATEEQIAGLDSFWQWFDSEPWVYEERSLWKYLENRFGPEKYKNLRDTFYDYYITEIDVQRVAEHGLNLIRIPIWYAALETDTVEGSIFNQKGWEKLDEIVLWARQHEVYLILDMHGAPGGQNTELHQGLENGGQLWSNQACIDKTVRLWKAIANYFKDEPHIAAYDLLNEPSGAPDKQSYTDVHDAIYQAIREVDTKHIVMIEDGYKDLNEISTPKEMGWDNAMFSVHIYPEGCSIGEYYERMEAKILDIGQSYSRFDCPLFLGEFNAAEAKDGDIASVSEAMDEIFTMLNERGIHWAFFSWKYFNELSNKGLYFPVMDPGFRIEIKDATYERIISDFERLHSSRYRAQYDFYLAVVENSWFEYRPLNLD